MTQGLHHFPWGCKQELPYKFLSFLVYACILTHVTWNQGILFVVSCVL